MNVLAELRQGGSNDQPQQLCHDIGSAASHTGLSLTAYSRSDFCRAPILPSHDGGLSRRIPCKARGMPSDHVGKNAYIEIPLDAKHGTTLTCSHPTCRLSGRIFRFCSVCQLPVAKRNFARRHTHGLSMDQIFASNQESSTVQLASPFLMGSHPRSMSVDPHTIISADTSSTISRPGSSPALTSSGLVHSGSGKRLGQIPVEISIDSNSSLDVTKGLFVNANIDMRNATFVSLSKKRPLAIGERTTVLVTEDELDWLFLFRQRPGPSDSREAWLKRVEQVAGVSMEPPKKVAKHQVNDDDEDEDDNSGDELSEIEAHGHDHDDLSHLDESKMDDLFE